MPYNEKEIGSIAPNTMSITEATEQWLKQHPVSVEDEEILLAENGGGSIFCYTDEAESTHPAVAVEALRRWRDVNLTEYVEFDRPLMVSGDESCFDINCEAFLQYHNIQVPDPRDLWRGGWEFAVLNGRCNWIDLPRKEDMWVFEDCRFVISNALIEYYDKVYGDDTSYINGTRSVLSKYDHGGIVEEFNRVMMDAKLSKSYLDSQKTLDVFPVFTAIVEKHRIKG